MIPLSMNGFVITGYMLTSKHSRSLGDLIDFGDPSPTHLGFWLGLRRSCSLGPTWLHWFTVVCSGRLRKVPTRCTPGLIAGLIKGNQWVFISPPFSGLIAGGGVALVYRTSLSGSHSSPELCYLARESPYIVYKKPTRLPFLAGGGLDPIVTKNMLLLLKSSFLLLKSMEIRGTPNSGTPITILLPNTWRIISLSMWLTSLVRKSPRPGVVGPLPNGHSWLADGGDPNCLHPLGAHPPSTVDGRNPKQPPGMYNTS